jgi:hypothetical protein
MKSYGFVHTNEDGYGVFKKYNSNEGRKKYPESVMQPSFKGNISYNEIFIKKK